MEIMGNNNDRTPDRCWEIVKEIDKFIVDNDKDKRFSETREQYYWNYTLHLSRLLKADQIIIQRNDRGKIVGICGWIQINENDERYINKITWSLPKNISEGNIIYIPFCIIQNGDIFRIRKELYRRFKNVVDEVYWFDSRKAKFIRIKNMIKEKMYV